MWTYQVEDRDLARPLAVAHVQADLLVAARALVEPSRAGLRAPISPARACAAEEYLWGVGRELAARPGAAHGLEGLTSEARGLEGLACLRSVPVRAVRMPHASVSGYLVVDRVEGRLVVLVVEGRDLRQVMSLVE